MIAAASILAGISPTGQACFRPAYGGYTPLYAPDRTPGPILEAACWAHARRPFFALADIEASARRKAEGKVPAPISPLALEIVQRIDALFEIERSINGKSADERRAVRQELSRPLVADLKAVLRAERKKLARSNNLAKAMDYMLKRWLAFTRFLDDGRVCLSNNAAERGLRGIPRMSGSRVAGNAETRGASASRCGIRSVLPRRLVLGERAQQHRRCSGDLAHAIVDARASPAATVTATCSPTRLEWNQSGTTGVRNVNQQLRSCD